MAEQKNLNPVHVVVPEGWLTRGDAFASGQQRLLSIFGGIPGEKVRVRIVGEDNHQVYAKLLSFVKGPHPTRVQPPCDRYTACGQCPLMHLNDEGHQNAWKWILQDAKLPTTEVVVAPPARDGLHTLDLHAGYSDRNSPKLGKLSRQRWIAPIPNCPITSPGLRELMKSAAYHFRDLRVEPFFQGRGVLKRLTAFESPDTQEIQMRVIAARSDPRLGEWARAIASSNPHFASAWVHFEDERREAQMRQEGIDVDALDGHTLLYGKPTIEWQLAGIRKLLGPNDAPPRSPAHEAQVLQAMIEAVRPGDAVLDATGGNAAMLASKVSGWALSWGGSEIERLRLKEEITLNRLPMEAGAGELDTLLPRLEGARPVVIVDGGRKGVTEGWFPWLQAVDARCVVVHANNPKALSKDIARLQAQGFVLERVRAFAESPHQTYLRCVATLRSKDNRAPERRAPQRKIVRR